MVYDVFANMPTPTLFIYICIFNVDIYKNSIDQKAFKYNFEALFDLIIHHFIDQTLIYGKFMTRLLNEKLRGQLV